MGGVQSPVGYRVPALYRLPHFTRSPATYSRIFSLLHLHVLSAAFPHSCILPRETSGDWRDMRPHARLPVLTPPHTHITTTPAASRRASFWWAVGCRDRLGNWEWRLPEAGLPHPPPLTPFRPPSTAIVLHTDPLENDEQQAASCAFFSFSRDWKCHARESIASYPKKLLRYSRIYTIDALVFITCFMSSFLAS